MQDTHRLDPSALRRLEQMGGERVVHGLIDLFLAHTPDRLRSLRAAWEGGDLDGVRRAAHSIKGTAATLGAVEMQSAARALEEHAARGEGEPLPALIARLEGAYTALVPVLTTLLRP